MDEILETQTDTDVDLETPGDPDAPVVEPEIIEEPPAVAPPPVQEPTPTPPPVVENAPVGYDPVAIAIEPYRAELQRMFDAGEISEAQANYMLRSESDRIRFQHTTQSQFAEAQGTAFVNKARDIMRQQGVEVGSDVEREVFNYLREDYKLDVNSPQSFAIVPDDASLKKVLRYATALAQQEKMRRDGVPVKPKLPVVQGASGGANSGSSRPAYVPAESLREARERAIRGEFPPD